jgi:hypothetical protein
MVGHCVNIVDARIGSRNNFYMVIPLQGTAGEWRNTNEERSRPNSEGRHHLTWNSLYPQIYDHVEIILCKGILKIYLLNKIYN